MFEDTKFIWSIRI